MFNETKKFDESIDCPHEKTNIKKLIDLVIEDLLNTSSVFIEVNIFAHLQSNIDTVLELIVHHFV